MIQAEVAEKYIVYLDKPVALNLGQQCICVCDGWVLQVY